MAKADEIRRAVEQLGKRGRGNAYPKAFREEVMAYVQARRDAGVQLKAIGAEIGMSWQTFVRWRERSAKHKAFRRVEVVAARGQLVVHGPRGLRIDGLGLDGVAELWRRLG